MELILLNLHDDDITATVEIESNIIDWEVEEVEGDDSSIVFPVRFYELNIVSFPVYSVGIKHAHWFRDQGS